MLIVVDQLVYTHVSVCVILCLLLEMDALLHKVYLYMRCIHFELVNAHRFMLLIQIVDFNLQTIAFVSNKQFSKFIAQTELPVSCMHAYKLAPLLVQKLSHLSVCHTSLSSFVIFFATISVSSANEIQFI